ncbi:acyltransferase [Rhodocytophaga rosea]|uniref:Acyltransferase n=1 Tax=Rhodocytophaga rosea TaxID=2704465 RepID=A0A6C0GCB7_9BACT|nr:acyltransferase [Rhodocytophaga rosea]QHT65472.1 acyltransferase [Rhodocytophaga rosea]
MTLLKFINKTYKFLYFKLAGFISWIITWIKFKLNGVYFSPEFISGGVPIIKVELTGRFTIGKKFKINNGKYHNMIGRQQPCYFLVGKNGVLKIGNNVGISSSAIVCHHKVEISDDVKIGGNVVIYDTDFHSLNYMERNATPEIYDNIKTAPVIIKEGAFIITGAHSIILKGVSIGKNSIVGAGSVVTKSIPDNQVWAGNPARFIKSI